MKPEPGSWQAEIVELLETLRRFRVPFLIAEGFAVAHAGHLRATKDVDIFVPSTNESSRRLARALSDFLGADVSVEETRGPFLRFFIGRPGAFDIVRKLPGVTWKTAWKERSMGPLFGLRVPFLGINTLIRNKRAVGRHVDLADVEALLHIRSARR